VNQKRIDSQFRNNKSFEDLNTETLETFFWLYNKWNASQLVEIIITSFLILTKQHLERRIGRVYNLWWSDN